jgi:hypothetical protein
MKPESEKYTVAGSNRRENPRLAAELNRPDTLECVKVKRGIPVAFDLTPLYLHEEFSFAVIADSQTVYMIKDWSPPFLPNLLILFRRKNLMIWDGILVYTAIRWEVLGYSRFPEE